MSTSDQGSPRRIAPFGPRRRTRTATVPAHRNLAADCEVYLDVAHIPTDVTDLWRASRRGHRR